MHGLILILGIANFTLASMLFLSCRHFVNIYRLFTNKNVLQNHDFAGFYQAHAYYWYIFWFSIVLHVMTALMHLALFP